MKTLTFANLTPLQAAAFALSGVQMESKTYDKDAWDYARDATSGITRQMTNAEHDDYLELRGVVWSVCRFLKQIGIAANEPVEAALDPMDDVNYVGHRMHY